MKIFLVSNNSLLEGLNYSAGTDLDLVRLVRPLSVKGEESAKEIASKIKNISALYSSFYASAISCAKYIAEYSEVNINLDSNLNDCKVGSLGSKNMKMVKGMQDHDFDYRLPGGESLHDAGRRLKSVINNLEEDTVIFTHKRVILGYLLEFASIGYNLDDALILEYKGIQIYDDIDSAYDIYELNFEGNNLVDIKRY